MLPRILRIHRYPAYAADVWIGSVLPLLLRRRGGTIERGVRFAGRPIVSLAPDSRLAIGEGSLLISRGRDTALGVSHPVILRTLRPGAAIEIGRRARFSGCTLCAAARVLIGNDVCIGSGVTIADTDFHALDPDVRQSEADAARAAAAPVKIGDDCFLGAGSFILKGVTLGRGVVVGAGSVVTHSAPDFAIVAGNPAKQIGSVARQAGAAGRTGDVP